MKWIFSLILFWLVFVVSLASWWLYFGVTTLAQATEHSSELSLIRHQKMLFMEGCVLLIFLVGGGAALFYFSYRMYKEKSAKDMFFASFTHDLKTALFRMQLQIEKLGKKDSSPEIEELLGHTRKMNLDLENSLDSTAGSQKKIFIEDISLRNFMGELHAQWPEFRIKFSGEEILRADRKALHSIFKNLLHNSFVHGKADEVSVELKKERGRFRLIYSDNGVAFEGNVDQLGQAFYYQSGGSGFGLFIVDQWVRRLGGKVHFLKSASQALEVNIDLPKGGK